MLRHLNKLIFGCSIAVSSTATADTFYLQLQDRLDRPADGYCIDVLGAGRNFRTDMPLTAHNCKPGNAPDGRVQMRSDGTLYMPAFDACVTPMGVNQTLLPGAAVMLRPCDDGAAFAQPAALKQFEQRRDGTLRMGDGTLCLTVGTQSGPTFSASHAWRALFVDTCSAEAADRQRWQFIPPFGTG